MNEDAQPATAAATAKATAAATAVGSSKVPHRGATADASAEAGTVAATGEARASVVPALAKFDHEMAVANGDGGGVAARSL